MIKVKIKYFDRLLREWHTSTFKCDSIKVIGEGNRLSFDVIKGYSTNIDCKDIKYLRIEQAVKTTF